MFNNLILLVLAGLTAAAIVSRCQLELRLALLLRRRLASRPLLFILVLMQVPRASFTTPYHSLPLLTTPLPLLATPYHHCAIVVLMQLGLITSMCISNVTAPILLLSVIQPMLRELPSGSAYGRALTLGLAFSCNLGGMLTPIASPQNAVALEVPMHAPQPPRALGLRPSDQTSDAICRSPHQYLHSISAVSPPLLAPHPALTPTLAHPALALPTLRQALATIGVEIAFGSWLAAALPVAEIGLLLVFGLLMLLLRPFDVTALPRGRLLLPNRCSALPRCDSCSTTRPHRSPLAPLPSHCPRVAVQPSTSTRNTCSRAATWRCSPPSPSRRCSGRRSPTHRSPPPSETRPSLDSLSSPSRLARASYQR